MRAASKIRCLLPLLGLIGCGAAVQAQDIVLVANAHVQISKIAADDLRAIFTGSKTRFSDGSHAVPVTLKGGPAHEVFLQNYIGENPAEFRAQWRRAVFTGQGAMPKALDSESAVIDYVSATPGAIGYVSRVSSDADVKSIALEKR